MYNNVRKYLLELKDKDLIAVIDEGRSRKRKENVKLKVFIIEYLQ